MEEIGNSLNQSMADIFETKSPLAKSRDKLKIQIEVGKVVLEKLTELFNVEKRNDLELITSLYSVVSHRMDRLDSIKRELQELTEV